jgi:hypothetical protein
MEFSAVMMSEPFPFITFLIFDSFIYSFALFLLQLTYKFTSNLILSQKGHAERYIFTYKKQKWMQVVYKVKEKGGAGPNQQPSELRRGNDSN